MISGVTKVVKWVKWWWRTVDKRYLVYGVAFSSGRYLFIVGISKGKGIFRTITARDMTEREKFLYRRREKQ